MNHEDLLWVIAQLAIGIGGFTGLISVLSDVRLKVAFRLIFEHMFGAVAFSLLPSLLAACGATEPWIALSALLGVFYLYVGSVHLYYYFALGRRGIRPRSPLLFWTHLIAGSFGMSVVQAINAIHWQQDYFYLVGVVWLLTPLAVQFLLFLNGSITAGPTSDH